MGAFEEDTEFWERSDLAGKLSLGSIVDGWHPNHGEIYDIDDDGDLDIILSAQDQRSNPTASRILVLRTATSIRMIGSIIHSSSMTMLL